MRSRKSTNSLAQILVFSLSDKSAPKGVVCIGTGWRRLTRVAVSVHRGAESTSHGEVKGRGDGHLGGRQRRRGKGGVTILAQLLWHLPRHDGNHGSRRGDARGGRSSERPAAAEAIWRRRAGGVGKSGSAG